jgi:hypothetical protein
MSTPTKKAERERAQAVAAIRQEVPQELAPSPKKRIGRPPKHVPPEAVPVSAVQEHADRMRMEAVEYVLAEMTNGRTMSAVSAELGVPPGAMRYWLTKDPALYKRYQVARELQGTAYAEHAVDIADGATNKTVGVARLRVDTYRWFAARANPREWGDKQFVESEGTQTLRVVVEEEEGAPAKQVARASAVMSAAVDALDVTVEPTKADADSN